MKKSIAKTLCTFGSVASVALLTGCSDNHDGTSLPRACEDLINLSLANTALTSAQWIYEDTAQGITIQHCEVTGSINERTSPVDGQTYAIKFRLRMPSPAAWNGRFYFSGGGGTDGSVGAATGAPLTAGFAVVATDSGHDDTTNTSVVAAAYQFGYDPQARSDYGYNGPAQTATKAKAIIQAYYDRDIDYSYFVGCSEGGREGLMFSQRYPDYFNGIVAGNPGMDLPKAAVAEAWDSQAFAEAAQSMTPFGNPDLASSFSDADLAAVSDAILAACDADDGLVDGMVFAPKVCSFDPVSIGPAGTGDITAVQVTALQKVFSGAENALGDPLYAGWYWDPGIVGSGWRQWKIGPLFPGFPVPGNSGINITLGGGALPFIFTSPPNSMTNGTALAAGTVITSAGPLGPGTENFGDAYVPWVLSYNMDTDAPKIFATDATYTESAMDFMASSSTDYTAFNSNGSKLIVYSGQADPVFSSIYHTAWYDALVGANAGLAATQNFARLYVVPGMNHCGGGPATSQFDALAALMDWVENNNAPDSITATAPAGTPWPGRTRPLCAYPLTAVYDGSGDIEDAASFSCQ